MDLIDLIDLSDLSNVVILGYLLYLHILLFSSIARLSRAGCCIFSLQIACKICEYIRTNVGIRGGKMAPRWEISGSLVLSSPHHERTLAAPAGCRAKESGLFFKFLSD